MTTSTGTDVIQALIQGLVDIDEEYERVVKPLEAKRKKQREVLRDAMIEAEKLEAIDEVSGYKAVLTHTERDVYVAEKLLPLLKPSMAHNVMVTSVDAAAVKELVDAGIITRTEMQREGALLREAKTRPFIKLIPLTGKRP